MLSDILDSSDEYESLSKCENVFTDLLCNSCVFQFFDESLKDRINNLILPNKFCMNSYVVLPLHQN